MVTSEVMETIHYLSSIQIKVVYLFLFFYVDDILITGNDEEEIKDISEGLARQFDIKSLGTLKYFLRIEVAYFREGIFIS